MIRDSLLCKALLAAILICSGLQIRTYAEELPSKAIVPAEVQRSTAEGLHRIEASAGPHGSISPAGAVSVKDSTDQIFTITPDSNYYVDDVLVDGLHAGAVTSYKFSGVAGDHTISATFIPCIYSLSRKKQVVRASGGSFSFDITASDASCSWSSSSDDPMWISTVAKGRGNGKVVFSIRANSGPARTGYLIVEGRRFAIDQESGCTYKLDRTSESVGAPGGSYAFRVTPSDNACAWTASSNNPLWISPKSSGSEDGIGSFAVLANIGPARSGSLVIGGQTFTVSQESGCTFELNPAGALVSAKEGTHSLAIKASDSGCAWEAKSNSPSWITTSQSGTGSGSVNYMVQENSGAERSSSISVAGHSFPVNQEDGCAYSFEPENSDAGIQGGFYGFAVSSSDSSCSWKARTDNPLWISTSSAGTAGGTVGYSIAANSGPDRTGFIFIGKQGFRVRQASGCRYSISPSGGSIPAVGGEFTFAISTSDKGCPWTAKSNDPGWIATTDSGRGSGAVNYSVAANPGLTRIGSLTAAGENFVVSQGNGCRYRLSQTVSEVGSSAGRYSFSISASDGACPWTAVSNNSLWIATSASGNGEGTVSFTVQAHEGPERDGTIVVGGQTLTVRQASGCRYRLSKASSEVGPSKGTYSIGVGASDLACPWTAYSKDPSWLISSSSGTGNGTVIITVQSNTGPTRTGFLAIGDQTFTVTQGNGCSFVLNPVGDSIPPFQGSHSFHIAASSEGCPWTAKSESPAWVATESSGTGDGTVEYTAAANHQAARKGLISVGGQSFAVFQASGINYSLTINKAGSGTGTVSSSEAPDPVISCDGACPSAIAPYIDGTTVGLKAAPDESSTFNGWSGACSGSRQCSVKLDANKSVSAAFIKKVRMVHARAGEGGGISPLTQAARHGETMQFTVTPNAGYRISKVTGCGISHDRSSSVGDAKKNGKAGSWGPTWGEIYETAPVTADCSIKAEFVPEVFTVTPTAGEHGNITSSTPQTVKYNGTLRFAVKADAEYHIESVTGCGGNEFTEPGKAKTGKKAKAVTEYSYTTGKIIHDCKVAAKFGIDTYSVTPKAEKHGKLEPSTAQTVNRLDMISFTITPDPGYHVASVSGCGGEFLSEDEYVTGYITEDCTVNAAFRLDHHSLTVSLSGDGGGTIAAAGLNCDGRICKGSFDHGKRIVLKIKPAAGSRVEDVSIDGATIGAQKTVIISEVKSDSSIEVVFAPLKKK
ncbi:MAG TPA: BACON domain-containing carbohydrate-binding protein [Thermodesulfovibrionales bacterium]|nr:BACON domain-containing carbohydrate-binding protein [Thermodesulfovibrionales bacterium]